MALVGGRTGVGGARAGTRCKQSCFYAQWLSLLCWSGAVAGGRGAGARTPEGAGFSRVWRQSHLGLGQRQGLRPWGPTSVLVLLSPPCVPSVRGWCHATELTPALPLCPPEGICPAAMILTPGVRAGIHELVTVASTPVRAGPGARLAPCPRVCILSLAMVACALEATSTTRARGAGAGAWCGLGGTLRWSPSILQPVASVLSLGGSRPMHDLLKSGVSVPYSPQ